MKYFVLFLGVLTGLAAAEAFGIATKNNAVEKQSETGSVEVSTGSYGVENGVKGKATFTVDGIKFNISEDVGSYDNYVGLADIDDRYVELKSNRTVKQFYSTCVHEVVGHVRSGYTHPDKHKGDEWIDRVEDELVVDTCLKVLYRLDGGDAHA